jgi:hypothetical protein
MKPLIDMTAKNDNAIEPLAVVAIERARKRSHRERHLKGPMWAQAPRDVDAAS